MKKPNFQNIIKTVKMSVSKHSPEILIGIGITGMVTTTVLAIKATPKALKLIEEKKKEESKDNLTVAETIKVTWKCYIPCATTGLTSIACIIGANSVHARRNAALATAYKLSETAFNEYREKVVETIGDKKEKNIREEIGKDRIEKNPASKNEVIITKNGDTLCFDPITGRYFKSDIDKIKKAENELNKRMLCDIFGYISLNEFYDEIGLDRVERGEELGWNLDNGKGLIDISFSAQVSDNGQPCLVLDYRVAPKHGYDK